MRAFEKPSKSIRKCNTNKIGLYYLINFGRSFVCVWARECMYGCVSACTCLPMCTFFAIPHHCGSANALIAAARLCVRVCAFARVFVCVSLSLIIVAPLTRLFQPRVCVCMCVCVCVCACVCLCSTSYLSLRSEISDFANSKKNELRTDRRSDGQLDR